jgi:hypothetical protein
MIEAGSSASRGSAPSLGEVRGWVGAPIDEIGGTGVGRVQGVFADSANDTPAWLLARLGRFGKLVAIPCLDCAAAAGRVWVAHTRDALHDAPAVDPKRALTREQELALCGHYGIDGTGRAQELGGRPRDAITSRPIGDRR